MRILITAIVTTVVVSFLWFATLRYKPNWIAKIMLDANGFPRIKKSGDRFIKDGVVFWYDGSIWVKLNAQGFPIDPTPSEGMTFIIGTTSYTYTNGVWILTPTGGGTGNESGRTGLILFDKTGNPLINNGKTKKCPVECLVPYGPGTYTCTGCIEYKANF